MDVVLVLVEMESVQTWRARCKFAPEQLNIRGHELPIVLE